MDICLEIKQSLNLSPQLIHTMEVLQMSSQELLDYVDELARENPVIEIPESKEKSREISELLGQLDWLKQTTVSERRAYPNHEALNTLNMPSFSENDLDELHAYLMSQLRMLSLSPNLHSACAYVIENIDDNGYLGEQTDQLAKQLGVEQWLISDAIGIVQSMEPIGVCARDLSECLCIQLQHFGGEDLAYRLAKDWLNELGHRQYTRIANKMRITEEEVQAAASVLRTLAPRPGCGFTGRNLPHYIIPDILVSASPEGGFTTSINSIFTPELRLSSYYRKLCRDTTEPGVQQYLTEKFRQARRVAQSINQRGETVRNCANAIVEQQNSFFRNGPGYLLPMTQNDVASYVGVHESTVCRAIKNKYLRCEFGVFPLSIFFSRALGSGNDMSPDKAKAEIKKLIKKEDPGKTL